MGMLGVYKKHKQFPQPPTRLTQPNLNRGVISGTNDQPADISGFARMSRVFWVRRM